MNLQLFAYNAILILTLLFLLWIVSLKLKNVSIVDIFWGLGFVFVAVFSFYLNPTRSSRSWMALVLVTVWGLRLSGYLAWRNLGKPEDYRYQAMRANVFSSFKCFWSLTFGEITKEQNSGISRLHFQNECVFPQKTQKQHNP
jgi:steroid 5-alpha reductase family enzyme